MCFRSVCVVEIESFEIWDVGFPKVSSDGISDSSGMSGNTLLSTTLLDAMIYGLHWMNVSLMLIPPGVHICLTRVSVPRYTHILSLLSLDAYLIFLPPIVSAIFRRYSSIVNPSTASKMTPCFLCGV
jgi:hypothetical protein